MNNDILDKLVEMSELLDKASGPRKGKVMYYVGGYGYVPQSRLDELIANGQVRFGGKDS